MTAMIWDESACQGHNGPAKLHEVAFVDQSVPSNPPPACRVCRAPSVKARERCAPCYGYWRRTGMDRPPHLLRNRKKDPRQDRGVEDDSFTFAEWCRATGYDPKRRKYR